MTRSSALRTWAEGLYERYSGDIAALMGADEIPAVIIHVEHHGPGAAWTSGTDVFLSKQWFTQHPDDVGGVLHPPIRVRHLRRHPLRQPPLPPSAGRTAARAGC